ncbi:MAG TPA: hypothetical protein ENK56_07585, partial [Chloroflexi bacterium]|nr:hypothetical protein [Chloroflexota bacterium]
MTALGIALGYYAALSPWFANLGFTVLYRPLIAGTLVGWLLGDPLTGMQVGAAINVLYLGWIGAGGHLPGDAALAGYLGTALALLGPLPPLAVLPLVVPISFAGGLLWLARMRAGVHFARWTDRMLSQPPPASKAQVVARLFLTHVLLPQLLLLLLTLLPVGLAAAWLLPPLARFLATLPPLPLPGGPYDLVRGLERAGGLLTAVGIALGMRNLFRRPFVAHFLLGFLFSVLGQHRLPGDVGLLALAGLALALLPPIPDGPAPSEAETASERPAPKAQPPPPPLRRPRRLTWGDLRCSWLLWLFFSHANYNWERLQGTGFAWAMVPIHRRLQPDGETMAAAL